MRAGKRAARDESEQRMIRTIGLLASLAFLAACGGDNRGSANSGTRAEGAAVAYVPVTPGAQPLQGADGQVQTRPVALTPGAVPVPAGDTYGQAELVTVAAVTPVARPPAAQAPTVKFATGPIFDACRKAGRAGATRARCGCVQWTADQDLTGGQQRRGARYFTDQHDLQEVRQSDDASNAEFWRAWSKFGARADEQCRGE